MKRPILLIILISILVSPCQSINQNFVNLEQKDSVRFNRPQNPIPPFPYKIEDVSYLNHDKSIQFGGTLTIPEKGDKHPVAILISGSAQQDRDETIFGHKPFWIIADHLTKNGIAVLRVDDRGIGATSGRETLQNTTSYDYALDVIAGIEYLKTRKEIKPTEIGLIGHSEGAIIATIIGAERIDIAFIVSMAGLGVSGKDFTSSQTKTKLLRYFPPQTTDSILSFENKVINIVSTEQDNFTAWLKMRELYSVEWIAKQDSITQAYFGFEIIDKDMYQMGKTLNEYKKLTRPWNRYLLSFAPDSIYPQISAPFLALNGEKDKQVLADLNLSGFKNIFEKCGKTNFKIISYPDLNHFFQHCKSGYYDEVDSIEETISPEVLNDMTSWINEQIKNNNNP